jgi:hypothetical protein
MIALAVAIIPMPLDLISEKRTIALQPSPFLPIKISYDKKDDRAQAIALLAYQN